MIMSQRERNAAQDDTLNTAVEAALAASRGLFGSLMMTMAGQRDDDDAPDKSPDLTITQYRALTLIASHGPLRPRDFVTAFGVSPATAGRIGDRLVTAGLAKRGKDPGDGRSVLFAVSPKGRDLVDRILDRRRVAFAHILKELEEHELLAITPVFKRFAEVAREPMVTWLSAHPES